MADPLPVLDRERHADMAGDGVDVDRRVGRSADRGIHHDRVLERFAGENVGRLQILVHQFDRAQARLVGDLPALAIGRRDRGATRQRHAERFGERVHGRGRAHGVAMPGRRRRRGDEIDEFVIIDLAGGELLARLPHDRAGARALALPPAVQHRPAGEHDGGEIHRRRRHDAGGRRLVAARGQHHAVERIAEQQFDEAEIGEVAVERRGRPFAGLLDRMHRKFERDAAGGADALADALGELQVMPVAGREVRARLRDADDGLARLQLRARQPEIEVALEINRRHARIFGIVEPQLRAQAALRDFRAGVGHRLLPEDLLWTNSCA